MTNFSNVKMQLGKDAVDDRDGVTVKVNGQDFNPNFGTHWSGSYSNQSDVYVGTQTTSFDLSGFQNGHEVCIGLRMYENNSGSTQTNSMAIRREKSTDGGSTYQLIYLYNYGNRTLSDGYREFFYSYIGIDRDEIRDDSTYYRVRFLQNGVVQQTINFTTSNTSINSTLRKAGYMRVEGNYLHYTDGSKGNGTGYEHTIATDTSYSSHVGADKKGYIRLDDGGINRRIYYISESGYRKRTYEADNRYGGASSVGTNRKGYMWIPGLVGASSGYAYNCFVGNNGYRYRIMNGPTR